MLGRGCNASYAVENARNKRNWMYFDKIRHAVPHDTFVERLFSVSASLD
jgi:hypothetical protein